MRKNAVDNTLTPIDGGVCAPNGFLASGFHCGISAYGTHSLGQSGAFSRDIREDISLVYAQRRCSVACVFAQGNTVGAPITVSKKHAQLGYARAIFCNSGIANVLQTDGKSAAEKICRAIAEKTGISKEEVLIASTGFIGERYPTQAVLNGLDGLVQSLGGTNENSLSAARGMMSTDSFVKQLSFSFSIGSYPCKIGVIFKGKTQVCPNMATTLCFLTTDVNITPQMLQKALSAATNEGFNMLCLDGASSPNDCVFILANGEAGNYKISCADSEYKKFARILCDVVSIVCKTIALEGDGKVLLCRVLGAKSKRTAYSLAKSLLSDYAFKVACQQGKVDVNSVYAALCKEVDAVGVNQAEISLRLDSGELLLAEDGKTLPLSQTLQTQILQTTALELIIKLHDGNYGATAYGNI